MARESTEAKLVSFVGGQDRRPDPPSDLNERQQEIWRQVVASEAVTFFDTAALRGLLVDYCRHKTTAEDLTQQIEKYDATEAMDPDTIKAFDRLTKMRDREIKGAADLATKMRLTNQSRYTPKAAGTAAKSNSTQKKPWERA